MAALIIGLAWVGLIAGAVGVIWIAIIAFQEEQPIWGIACLLCFPAALIYGVMRFDEAKIPLGILAVGIAVRLFFAVLRVMLVT